MNNSFADDAKPRITGGLMNSFKDKNATIVGYFVKRDSEGKRLTIKTTDDKFIQLVMALPVSGEIVPNCVIEAYGTVQSNNTFICHDYITFPTDMSEKFDRGLYNDFIVEFMKHSDRHYNVERPEDHEGPLITPHDSFAMPEVNSIGNSQTGETSMMDY